jgi:hypothetical protein
MNYSERGSAVVIALILSALAVIVLASALCQLAAFQQFFGNEIRGVRDRISRENALIEQLGNGGMKIGSAFDCLGAKDSPLRLCGMYSSFFKAPAPAIVDGRTAPAFPLIDFDSLLGGPLGCAGIIALPGRTSSGRELSPMSADSRLTCEREPLPAANGLLKAPNLDLSALTLHAGAVLAARGYTAIGNLTVEGEVSVISAGDLLIGTIESGASAHMALISTTGIVEAEAVSPNVEVSAAGWAGVTLPAGTRVSSAPLPYLRERMIIGFLDKEN